MNVRHCTLHAYVDIGYDPDCTGNRCPLCVAEAGVADLRKLAGDPPPPDIEKIVQQFKDAAYEAESSASNLRMQVDDLEKLVKLGSPA